MSPYYFNSTFGRALVFHVSSVGRLGAGNYGVVWTDPGVRPVINLKSAIAITGSGTTSDPFKIQ